MLTDETLCTLNMNLVLSLTVIICVILCVLRDFEEFLACIRPLMEGCGGALAISYMDAMIQGLEDALGFACSESGKQSE